MENTLSQPNDLQLQKYSTLLSVLKKYHSTAVAFSGGVDSSFLLYAAKQALDSCVIAVTLSSDLFPKREQDEAAEFCRIISVEQHIIRADELSIPGFSSNPPDRCYLCKKELFSKICAKAAEYGMNTVAEGSNMDDLGDYRPGLRAITELDILSPLRSADLYKEDIRALSAWLGLPTASKPSYACLASRFVYGETITPDKLKMVEKAEDILLHLGLQQMRVRIHGDLARIEVPANEISRIASSEIRIFINERFKSLGFRYVTLDLQGYRTGSMNEVL